MPDLVLSQRFWKAGFGVDRKLSDPNLTRTSAFLSFFFIVLDNKRVASVVRPNMRASWRSDHAYCNNLRRLFKGEYCALAAARDIMLWCHTKSNGQPQSSGPAGTPHS